MKNILRFILFLIPCLFFQIYGQSDEEKTPTKKSLKEDNSSARRWAIVVGINEYQDIGISPLQKARNDAKLIAQIMKEQGQFDEIYLLTDDVSTKNSLYPTRANIESKIDQVLDYASPADTVLFFFSGHGISDPSGNGYLLSVDTTIEKSLFTSIKINDIMRKIKERNITNSILILDACRDLTNSTTKGFAREGFKSEKYATGDIPVTFFSTRTGYYSYEDTKTNFGVFTKYLAYGMEGQADSNKDGIVTFSELEEFAQNGVTQWADQNDKEQKPFVNYHRDKHGKIPITISVEKKTSLVEDNNFPNLNSKLPALVRSFFVPGWGQWYNGGTEKGISFMSIFLILLGNVAYHAGPYQNAKTQYENTILIPARPNEGDTLLINYFLFEPKLSHLKKTKTKLNNSILALGAFWAWNLVDLFLYRGNNYFWAIQLQVLPASDRSLYTITSSDFDKKTNLIFTVRF